MAYEREQRIRDILWKEREVLLTSAGKVNREQMAEYLNEAGWAIENLISLNQYTEEYYKSAITTWFIDTYGRGKDDKVSREANTDS